MSPDHTERLAWARAGAQHLIDWLDHQAERSWADCHDVLDENDEPTTAPEHDVWRDDPSADYVYEPPEMRDPQ